MHHKEFTQALILGTINISENDKIVQLFSREFGRIDAIARGASSMKSKLRMNLSDYSLVDCFIIEGKSTSKIASVIIKNVYIKNDKNKNAFYIKILNLIKRFFQGRGDHFLLFEKLISVFDIVDEKNFSKDELKNIAIYLTMIILSDLGYFELDNSFNLQTIINEDFHRKILLKRGELESKLKSILIST